MPTLSLFDQWIRATVSVDRGPAQPVRAASTFDALVAALSDNPGRVEVRPLTDVQMRDAAMFDPGLEHPRLSRRVRGAA